MHRHVTTTAISAIVVFGLAACGPTATVSTQPDKTTAATSAPAKTTAPKKTATIGDAISVTGQTPGDQLTVTLTKWATGVHSTNDFESPDPGKTWVAAQFQIANTGKNTYSDSPGNCVQAADAQGQHFETTIVQDLANGPMMTSDLKLAPGDKALGWIVIEVPQGSKVTKVQFTPDSGMADATAQWAVK